MTERIKKKKENLCKRNKRRMEIYNKLISGKEDNLCVDELCACVWRVGVPKKRD